MMDIIKYPVRVDVTLKEKLRKSESEMHEVASRMVF